MTVAVPGVETVDRDLVVVTIPGVQRFVGEARSTADVATASRIVSELTGAMLLEVSAPAEVVLPAAGRDGIDAVGGTGLPNRVVVLTASGQGRELARRMAERVSRWWADRVAALWQGMRVDLPDVVGCPDVQWVVVAARPGGYREQWRRAAEALAARKRTRTFAAYDSPSVRRLCSLSGRWPAVEQVPRGVRRRRGEALSVPAVVKRADRSERFPSTASVATGPFRRDLARLAGTDGAVRAAVVELRAAVDTVGAAGVRFGSGRLPGLPASGGGEAAWVAEVEGACLLPETWSVRALTAEQDLTPADSSGFAAAVGVCGARLAELLKLAGLGVPASYLAVVVQDADSMGRRLADETGGHADLRGWHGAVSAALVRAADAQRSCLERGPDAGGDGEEPLGRLVYAGGDDALGFVPARTAIAAAGSLNAAFRDGVAGTVERPGVVADATASTAVVFCHVSAPLQSVLAAARELLEETKTVCRPGFGVAVWRRGGERVRAVRPWQVGPSMPAGTGAPAALTVLVDAMRGGLSGRLVADLERDGEAIASLSGAGRAGELRRLVRRHTTAAAAVDVDRVVDAVLALADTDQVGAGGAVLTSAARWAAVARFVAAEGR
ncbi:type III-B CRISPR-associated protein Cas10/Cmr2 [Dactylosporangium sp. NPDC049525]|uniref:Cas10/Cmr2 second palm domain-containing protein n=1 Tax=Dactylosporangium sp. NPDC049525 TaxID=3154730 RepID=UPI003434F6C7